ncbi:class I SAM-dependent methyltransferase [Demequina sp. SO4-13]|uniref:class I SAM-dependent methyltransferase n=1 Tax=Demequina sp. SO4-13 TaxID=3401027 RepID=UPI003AF5C5DB
MTNETDHGVAEAPVHDDDRQAWDQRYRERERVWTGHPNAPLIDEVEHIVTPGTALDVGCGEGADAVWLARAGWLVTAVDLSSTAVERARAHAQEAGVSHHVSFTDEDLATLVDSHGPWNLVTSMYTHPARGGRWLVETLAPAVAPGGMLLVVAHHPSDPHAQEHPELLAKTFTAEDVAGALDRSQWEVSATLRERTTREANGRERLWRDSVLVARRHD